MKTKQEIRDALFASDKRKPAAPTQPVKKKPDDMADLISRLKTKQAGK